MTPIEQAVVVDNDTVRIVVDATKVDADGDVGYVLSITNNRATKAWFYSGDVWKVKGAEVEQPVLRVAVGPGETVEEFMWFDRGNTGIDAESDLVRVEGSIVVEDADSHMKVGVYPFKA